MLKGSQRKVVVIKSPTSKYFDIAYFILKDSCENHTYKEAKIEAKDIVKEAIFTDAAIKNKSKKQAFAEKFFCFGAGAASSAVLCAALIIALA